ncbi:MAG: hypothetical protein ACYC6Y_14305 [Thermoguttaceae bacterium]
MAYNTFVHCKCNLAVGLGDSGDNAVLAPRNCTVANNVFILAEGQLVDEQSRPEAFVWQGNLVQAPGPVSATFGRRVSDLQFRQDGDGIWRPSPASPVVGAALGNFPEVSQDIDGEPRTAVGDAGCDQASPGGHSPGAAHAGRDRRELEPRPGKQRRQVEFRLHGGPKRAGLPALA